jgi:predicted dienelactone hydrolase
VVLLSHGAGSTRYANVSLSEVLARHGYLVAAPDHAGHTTADKVWGISENERAQSALDRPLDLSRVLDALERRAGSDPLLGGLVDLDRVAVAGHSFGGRTALGLVGAHFDIARQQQECLVDDDDPRCRAIDIFAPHARADRYRYRDPRVKAALLIAPAGFEFYREDGVAEVDAPVLVVGARRDQTTPFAERHKPVFDALTTPRHLLDLKNAGHLTATDVCDIVASIGFLGRTFGGSDARDGCGDDYLPSRRALAMVADASLAFLDVYLNRLPGATARLEAALEAPERPLVASRAVATAPGTPLL